MAAMSVSPIVPEGWKYAKCNLPACEHCAIQGMSTRDGKLLTCVFTGGPESLPSEVSQESPAQGPVVIRELPSGVSQESPSGVSQESPVEAPVAQHGHEVVPNAQGDPAANPGPILPDRPPSDNEKRWLQRVEEPTGPNTNQ